MRNNWSYGRLLELKEMIQENKLAIGIIEEEIEEIEKEMSNFDVKVGTVYKCIKNSNVYALMILNNNIVFQNLTNHNTYTRRICTLEDTNQFKLVNNNQYYITQNMFNWITRDLHTFRKVEV